MKFEDLSAADQKLLNTDLGDFEKDAAEQVALADEMYEVGFSKLALETADELDALMAVEKTASEDSTMDEYSEKTASDLSAFIERGFFDGLCKLGQERHGDEMAYLYSFLEEKIAAKAAVPTLSRVQKFLAAAKGKASEAAGYVKGKAGEASEAASKYHKGANKNLKQGVGQLRQAATGKAGKKPLESEARMAKAKAGAKNLGKGALKYAPHAAAGSGTLYAGKKLYDAAKSSPEG